MKTINIKNFQEGKGNKKGLQPVSRPVEQTPFGFHNSLGRQKGMFCKKGPGLQKEKGLAPPLASPYMLEHQKNLLLPNLALKVSKKRLPNKFMQC